MVRGEVCLHGTEGWVVEKRLLGWNASFWVVIFVLLPSACWTLCQCSSCLLHACVFSRDRLFATLWTVAHQASLSIGFSRQEYWSGLPFPSPGDLPDPGIKPRSPALQTDALLSEPPGKPIELLTKSSLGWDTQFLRHTPLVSPLPGKPIKLFFSTSPKTISLRFGLAPVQRLSFLPQKEEPPFLVTRFPGLALPKPAIRPLWVLLTFSRAAAACTRRALR